jgi:hypothetical protein
MRKLLLIGLILTFITSFALAQEAATVAVVEPKAEGSTAVEAVVQPSAIVEDKISGPEASKEETNLINDEQAIKTGETQKTGESKDTDLISPDKA